MALSNTATIDDLKAEMPSFSIYGLTDDSLGDYLADATTLVGNHLLSRGVDPDDIESSESSKFKQTFIFRAMQLVYSALYHGATDNEFMAERAAYYEGKYVTEFESRSYSIDVDGDGDSDGEIEQGGATFNVILGG
jgi:hypothetical protein